MGVFHPNPGSLSSPDGESVNSAYGSLKGKGKGIVVSSGVRSI